MKQSTTGYCAACEAQVTGRSAQENVGPDEQLYCDECRAMLMMMREQRHPGSTRASSLVRAVTKAGPARPRPAAAPRREAPATTPKPTKWIAIGAGVLVVAVVGIWFATRPHEEAASPAPKEEPKAAVTPAPAPPKETPAPQPQPAPPQPTPPTPEPPPPDPTPPPVEPPSPPPKEDPQPAPPAGALSPDDLKGIGALEGKEASVGGVVKRAEAAKSGKVFYINFSDDRNGFVAVIFPKKFAEFEKHVGGDLSKMLTGKSIVVRGKVETYKGRLQIVLEKPSQLEVK